MTLPIRIETSCGQTLQDQIYFCIRRSIVEGLICADSRLPSTRALAADLGVSLSAYCYGGGQNQNGLLLGFGACRPAAIRAGRWQLAAAIDAARRSQ